MVHVEIFGRPAIVGDAHVPAAAAPEVEEAAVVVDALDEDEEELLDVFADEGAVGNRVVLF